MTRKSDGIREEEDWTTNYRGARKRREKLFNLQHSIFDSTRLSVSCDYSNTSSVNSYDDSTSHANLLNAIRPEKHSNKSNCGCAVNENGLTQNNSSQVKFVSARRKRRTSPAEKLLETQPLISSKNSHKNYASLNPVNRRKRVSHKSSSSTSNCLISSTSLTSLVETFCVLLRPSSTSSSCRANNWKSDDDEDNASQKCKMPLVMRDDEHEKEPDDRSTASGSMLLLLLFLHILIPPVALLIYFANTIFLNPGIQRRGRRKNVPTRRLQYIFLLHVLSFLICCCIYFTSFSHASTTTAISALPRTTRDDTYDSSKSTSANPFSKHQRRDHQSDEPVCHVWSTHSIEALCSKGRWARLRLMREMVMFSRDCDAPSANIFLGEFFRLNWRVIKTEADLLAQTEHLRDGAEGRDCVLAPLSSAKCSACFARIDAAMRQLDVAYMAFEHTLRRFDCMLAVDSSSATRPFSPNGTCVDCKIWYRKWLLVELVRIWQQPPCINWCFYTQLACPHFGTYKVVDFAGHPAFMCRDLSIPPQLNTGYTDENGVQTCECVHPCDLHRNLQPPTTATRELARNVAALGDLPHDFYASVEHCWARRRRCRKQLANPFVEGVSRATASKFNAATRRLEP